MNQDFSYCSNVHGFHSQYHLMVLGGCHSSSYYIAILTNRNEKERKKWQKVHVCYFYESFFKAVTCLSHFNFIGQNLIIWLHLAVKEPDKCQLHFIHQCAKHKSWGQRVQLLRKRVRTSCLST